MVASATTTCTKEAKNDAGWFLDFSFVKDLKKNEGCAEEGKGKKGIQVGTPDKNLNDKAEKRKKDGAPLPTPTNGEKVLTVKEIKAQEAQEKKLAKRNAEFGGCKWEILDNKSHPDNPNKTERLQASLWVVDDKYGSMLGSYGCAGIDGKNGDKTKGAVRQWYKDHKDEYPGLTLEQAPDKIIELAEKEFVTVEQDFGGKKDEVLSTNLKGEDPIKRTQAGLWSLDNGYGENLGKSGIAGIDGILGPLMTQVLAQFVKDYNNGMYNDLLGLAPDARPTPITVEDAVSGDGKVGKVEELSQKKSAKLEEEWKTIDIKGYDKFKLNPKKDYKPDDLKKFGEAVEIMGVAKNMSKEERENCPAAKPAFEKAKGIAVEKAKAMGDNAAADRISKMTLEDEPAAKKADEPKKSAQPKTKKVKHDVAGFGPVYVTKNHDEPYLACLENNIGDMAGAKNETDFEDSRKSAVMYAKEIGDYGAAQKISKMKFKGEPEKIKIEVNGYEGKINVFKNHRKEDVKGLEGSLAKMANAKDSKEFDAAQERAARYARALGDEKVVNKIWDMEFKEKPAEAKTETADAAQNTDEGTLKDVNMQHVAELGAEVNVNDPLYKKYTEERDKMDHAVKANDEPAFEEARNNAFSYAGQLGAMPDSLDNINKLSFKELRQTQASNDSTNTSATTLDETQPADSEKPTEPNPEPMPEPVK